MFIKQTETYVVEKDVINIHNFQVIMSGLVNKS